MPVKNKKKFANLDTCLQEVELFVKNAKERFGQFEYAPPRTPYDPKREEEQIKIMYPKVREKSSPLKLVPFLIVFFSVRAPLRTWHQPSAGPFLQLLRQRAQPDGHTHGAERDRRGRQPAAARRASSRTEGGGQR